MPGNLILPRYLTLLAPGCLTSSSLNPSTRLTAAPAPAPAGFSLNRRHYLHIEEAAYLVDRADLMLFVEVPDNQQQQGHQPPPQGPTQRRLLSLQETFELMVSVLGLVPSYSLLCCMGCVAVGCAACSAMGYVPGISTSLFLVSPFTFTFGRWELHSCLLGPVPVCCPQCRSCVVWTWSGTLCTPPCHAWVIFS